MRINLFTVGDCTDLNTWSSLPYYFHRNLCDHGSVAVRSINLVPPENLTQRLQHRLMVQSARAIRLVLPSYRYSLLRTLAYHRRVNRQLQEDAERYRNADVNVFLTFSFSSSPCVGTPVIHYCDQTYAQHLEEAGIVPTRNDRRFMAIDQRNIESADLVLSTNQPCSDFIESHYTPKRAYVLRGGIGSDLDVRDPDALIARKRDSTEILFIGRGLHKRGVDVLIRAFNLFNEKRNRRFNLHIVGVRPEELPKSLQSPDPSIHFYGYLNRTIPEQLERYNELIQSAKLFVMPMREGPFPGVVREAQLNCTPIVASNVAHNQESLKHDRDAVLVDGFEPAEFADQMARLIDDGPKWGRMARSTHESAKGGTWQATVQRFLDIVDECNLVKGDDETSSADFIRGNDGDTAIGVRSGGALWSTSEAPSSTAGQTGSGHVSRVQYSGGDVHK